LAHLDLILMKMYLLLALVCAGALFGGERPEVSFDLFTKPSGSVSVATGIYSEVHTDVIVNCAEPIEIKRWYASSNRHDGHWGQWVIQSEEIRARVYDQRSKLDIFWDSEDGSSCHFLASKDWSFRKPELGIHPPEF
jgi:Domain of unknown function (DUF6531)